MALHVVMTLMIVKVLVSLLNGCVDVKPAGFQCVACLLFAVLAAAGVNTTGVVQGFLHMLCPSSLSKVFLFVQE